MTTGPVTEDGLVIATPAHARLLAEIHRQSFESPWSMAGFHRMLGQPNMLALAARDDQAPDGLDGFILCRLAAPEAEIVTLAVRPARRRRGIGRRLMEGSEVFLRRSAVEEWFLEVDAENVPAVAAYDKAGFEVVGTREGYYRSKGSRRDALLMRKLLV